MFQKKIKFSSEFRRDPVTSDWVLIATGRAKRPKTLKVLEKRFLNISSRDCPFCYLEETQERARLLLDSKGKKLSLDENSYPRNWFVAVIPNKYPAVYPDLEKHEIHKGVFTVREGVGWHEVVVLKSHYKNPESFSVLEMRSLILSYKERILDLRKKKFVEYIAVFHNKGASAGASLVHPHSQILAISVIDPDLKKNLEGARRYFKKYKRCIFCDILKYELKVKERVVYENKNFVVLCPFASKAAYMMQVFPKKHQSRFEDISEKDLDDFADAFLQALKRLKKVLKKVDYNFYLQTAPCRGNWQDYHWHFEIFPRLSKMAGFEFEAGIEISTIKPEEAALRLRYQKIKL